MLPGETVAAQGERTWQERRPQPLTDNAVISAAPQPEPIRCVAQSVKCSDTRVEQGVEHNSLQS